MKTHSELFISSLFDFAKAIMDTCAILDTARVVVQFANFTAGLISESKFKVYSSAAGIGNDIKVQTVCDKIEQLRDNLDSTSQSESLNIPTSLEDEYATIKKLSTTCKTNCSRLLGIIRSLKSAQPANASWQNFTIAVKGSRKGVELRRLEDSIQQTQVTCTIQIAKLMRLVSQVPVYTR